MISLLIGLLLAIVPGAEDADQQTVTASEHGFAVSKPAADWTLDQGDVAGKFTVASRPRGTVGEVGVSVKVVRTGGLADDVAMRDALIAGESDKPEVERIDEIDVEVGGVMHAGLLADTKSAGVVYRVRQGFVLRDEKGFIVQAHAPKDRFDSYAEAFDAWFGSFTLLERSPQDQEAARLRALAANCGSELDWAASWEEAAERARAEDRLVLTYARFYPGFATSDSMMTGPFMDPAIVELINERYVPVRLTKERPTLLHGRDRYGLSGSSFGVSLMACRPDGEVLREGFAEESSVVWEVLIDGLARAPEAVGPKPPSRELSPVERARRHVARGELELAGEALQGVDDREKWLVHARIHELTRHGEAALRALDRACEEGAVISMDVNVDRARIQLRLGRRERAALTLLRTVRTWPDHPRIAEARFLLGEARRPVLGRDAAKKQWDQVVAEFPDDRWAWKAAAALTSTLFSMGGGERQQWPDEASLASVRPVSYAPLPITEVARAEQDAVRVLLGAQLEDGSWPSPMSIESSGDFDTVDPFEVSITSIAVRGLLPHTQEADVRAAVDRGLAFLDHERARARATPIPAIFMDYTVWSKSYEVFALVEALAHGVLERETTTPVLDELVEDLRERQRETGGWSYYMSGEVGGTTVEQSISFVTAAVTAAVLRAREAGADVPAEMTDESLAALEAMWNRERLFDYFLFPGGANPGRATRAPGSAGRGPACALALALGGQATTDDIAAAIEVWIENADALAAEGGKALMHSGDDGQGCHYLMFDYARTASAISMLPAADRPRYRDELLQRILALRTEDGGFLDAPFLGRSFGAGMALYAFDRLK